MSEEPVKRQRADVVLLCLEPKLGLSGVTTYVQGLAPRLAFQGLEVLVVQAYPSPIASSLVRRHGRMCVASLGYLDADDLIATVRALVDGRPSVVHCHEDLLLPTAARLSTRFRSRLLHTVHFVHPGTVGLLREHRPYTLAVSGAVVKELRASGHSAEVWLLRNFADSRWRSKRGLVRRADRSRRSAGLDGNARIVLFAGRANSHQKGADLLVQAVVRIADTMPDLVFAFAGPYWLPPETSALVAGLQDRMLVLGTLRRGDLYAWYSTSSVVAVPSRHEPFGFTALEAQVVGTPVVAAAVGGLREIVHPEMGRLVEVRAGRAEVDPADLAQALISALDAPLSPEQSDALSSWTVTQFPVDDHVRTLLHLYGIGSGAATVSQNRNALSIQSSRTNGVLDYGDVGELDFGMTLDIARRQAAVFAKTADEREHLASEAVARAWEGRRRFDPDRGSLEQWLFGMVRNVAREWRRDQLRQRGIRARLLGQVRHHAAAPGSEAVDLHAAFTRLNQREQLVLYLRYWCDLPHAEIAGKVGISESASRQVARRALIRLGRSLR